MKWHTRFESRAENRRFGSWLNHQTETSPAPRAPSDPNLQLHQNVRWNLLYGYPWISFCFLEVQWLNSRDSLVIRSESNAFYLWTN